MPLATWTVNKEADGGLAKVLQLGHRTEGGSAAALLRKTLVPTPAFGFLPQSAKLQAERFCESGSISPEGKLPNYRRTGRQQSF